MRHWTITRAGGPAVGRHEPGGSRRYYVTDLLGSIRAVLDGSGSVDAVRNYYPFGLPLEGRYDRSSPATQEDFTGHEKDTETDLHYAGARYYSGAFGRWLRPDPVLGTNPKELLEENRPLLTMTSYNYAFDRPTTLTDPTGLAPMDWFRDENGDIRFNDAVESQGDLDEGQTYIGENALLIQKDGPTKLLTEGGERVKVFDGEGAVGPSAGASGVSADAAAVSSLLNAESVKGGKALSRLKVGTKVFGQSASFAAFGLSSGSEIARAALSEGSFFSPRNFGTYERVKLGADVVSLIGSSSGIGAAIAFGAEASGIKGALVRTVTREILKMQVDRTIRRRR